MNVNVSVVQLGVFVQPAGAQLRSSSAETALADIWGEVGECFGYAKPDGWRFQIHKQGEMVKLYSRSGKDWAEKFPYITDMIRTQLQCDEAILDTEVVGFDQLDCHLRPNELHNASAYRCYLLDALYLNGRDLTVEFTERRVALLWEDLHKVCQGALIFANYTRIRSLEDLINFYRECQKMRGRGFDGTIIKRLDTPYFTDVLKIKPRDSIDAVVLGAYLNKEERVNKLLLALPSHSDQSWKPIAIVAGSGANWDAIWSACQPYIINQRPYNLDYVHQKPNFWVTPAVVVTVQMTELQLGLKNYLVYTDAPRDCVLREDKGPNEADSFEQAYQKALSNASGKLSPA